MIKVNTSNQLEVHLTGNKPILGFGYIQISILAVTLIFTLIAYLSFGLVLSVICIILGFIGVVFSTLYCSHKADYSYGVLTISKGLIRHELHGKQSLIEINNLIESTIETHNEFILLTLVYANNMKTLISGFEYQREAEVLVESLQGKQISVRKQKIRMKK